MTKQDLAFELAERADISKNNALCLIDNMLEAMTECLERGESIFLRGLGTIKVVDSAERKARNPQTGEKVIVPARKAIRFKPALSIKRRING